MGASPFPALIAAGGIKAPQIENPLDNEVKQAQLAAAAQDQQAAALKTQQIKQQLGDYMSIKGILGKNNGDMDASMPEIMQTVSPDVGMSLQKTYLDNKKLAAETLDANQRAKVAAADAEQKEREYMGTIANSLLKENAPIPVVLTHLDQIEAMNPDHAQAIDRIKHQIVSAPDSLQGILNGTIQASGLAPKFQEDEQKAAQEERAQAGEQRTQQMFPSELLSKQAGARTAQDQAEAADRAQAAQLLSGAAKFGGAPALESMRKQLGSRAAAFEGMTDPQAILQAGLAPKDQLDQIREQGTAAETARHNQATEATAGIEARASAQRAATDAQKFSMEMGGDAVKGWAKSLAQNPDAAASVPPTLRTAVEQQFTKDTGLPFPKPLSGTAVDTERASRNALAAVAQINDALQDPEIQSRLGPIMGRLGQAEQAVGSAAGLSPQAEAKAQQLRTNMRYLVFQEGKAILGGRLPQNLMKELESSSPNTHMDAGTLQGAMAGVQDTALRNMDTADQQRFGGQMRSRQDRGIASTPLATGNVDPAIKDALSKLGPGIHKIPTSQGIQTWKKDRDGTLTKQQ